MLAIFLGGLSLHVSQALLSHMFEINMTWGATAKEFEFSNFFIEVPKVMKRFKFSFAFSLLGIVGMVLLAIGTFIPPMWRITDFVAILPMADCHRQPSASSHCAQSRSDDVFVLISAIHARAFGGSILYSYGTECDISWHLHSFAPSPSLSLSLAHEQPPVQAHRLHLLFVGVRRGKHNSGLPFSSLRPLSTRIAMHFFLP